MHRPWRYTTPFWGQSFEKAYFEVYSCGSVPVWLPSLLNRVSSDHFGICPHPEILFFVNYLVKITFSLSFNRSGADTICFLHPPLFFRRIIKFEVFLQGSKEIAYISQVIHIHHELWSSCVQCKRMAITTHKAFRVHTHTVGLSKRPVVFLSTTHLLPQRTICNAFQSFKARSGLRDSLLRTCPRDSEPQLLHQ